MTKNTATESDRVKLPFSNRQYAASCKVWEDFQEGKGDFYSLVRNAAREVGVKVVDMKRSVEFVSDKKVPARKAELDSGWIATHKAVRMLHASSYTVIALRELGILRTRREGKRLFCCAADVKKWLKLNEAERQEAVSAAATRRRTRKLPEPIPADRPVVKLGKLCEMTGLPIAFATEAAKRQCLGTGTYRKEHAEGFAGGWRDGDTLVNSLGVRNLTRVLGVDPEAESLMRRTADLLEPSRKKPGFFGRLFGWA